MGNAQAHGVLVVPVAPMPEHGLVFFVMTRGVEAEVLQAAAFRPFGCPAGERPRHLAHVGLAVGTATGPQREQLHHLACVVLVGIVLVVVDPVQEHEHRRVLGDGEKQVVEAAERVFAKEVVLIQHSPLAVDLVVGVRKPVVPDEGHPLRELLIGSEHPVEPPAVVMTPRAGGFERAAFVVSRFRPDELGGPDGTSQAPHDLF